MPRLLFKDANAILRVTERITVVERNDTGTNENDYFVGLSEGGIGGLHSDLGRRANR